MRDSAGVLQDGPMARWLRDYFAVTDRFLLGTSVINVPEEWRPPAAETATEASAVRNEMERRVRTREAGPRTEAYTPLTTKYYALMGGFTGDCPPPYSRIRELIELGLAPGAAAQILRHFGMDADDITEPSTCLRPPEPDPDDAMGAETDPGMGEAWFREQIEGESDG